MNPSSDSMKSFIQHKFIITLLLGLLLFVPFVATAQEATEEPQADPVVTVEAVEETTVEETIAPTEAPVVETEAPVEETPAPTEEPVVETEAPVEETDVATEDNTTATETETSVDETTEGETVSEEPVEGETPSTEEVISEATEEPAVDPVETEAPVVDESEATEATEAPETVVIEETPDEITSISEDFEAWTGNNWTVADWSVAQVDDSMALVSTVVGASAEVMSVDWTSYTIEVDIKVKADNLLSLNFDGYNLVIASDGSHQLLKDDEIVADPATVVESDTTEITWHTIGINKNENATTILIDGISQYGYQTDISPLGIFAFVATGDQGVAIDNLTMTKVETVVEQAEEVVATPAPEQEIVEAETTEEPDMLAEATEEPTVEEEATDEVVEVVEEAPAYIQTNLITEDFETDLSAWTTSASIVEVAEGNHVLLMGNGGQLTPATALTATNLIISGQVSVVSDADVAGNFSLALSDAYTVEISTTGVTISNNGEVVAVVESAQAVGTWFGFSVESTDAGISVSVNDVAVAEFSGELVLNGSFAFTANTGVMFDNLNVDSLSLEEVVEVVEVVATPAPEVANEDILSNLGGIAEDMMEAYFDGGDEAVATLLADSSDPQDEFGRVLVDILVNDGYTGDAIAQIVDASGGEATRIYEKSLEAYVNVSVLLSLGNHEGVRFVRDTSRAVSTGPTAPTGTFGSDDSWTEAFNLLSIEEWNSAGIDGQDVKIGVIDTGFDGADGDREDNLVCQASTDMQYVPPGDSITDLFDSSSPSVARDHGTQIMEVICDIAPAADVYMYRADDVASLIGAVNAAINPSNRMDIILITLDLGVNTSAGGGESGSVDENLYGLLEAVKDSGVVTIVAAGNNNQRTLNLHVTSDTTFEINLGITDGDQIKFGWNDFAETDLAEIDATLTSDSETDTGDSRMPYTDTLILDAEEDDTDALLTIDVDLLTSDPVYLQVQISPRIVSGEGNNISTVQAGENDVKFDFDTLQLQGGGDASANNITDTTGNLGRPADSDDVISVGAICTRPGEAPTRWEFSSNGPAFDSDGSPYTLSSPVTQADAKPSLMSYSFVTTRGNFAAPEGAPAVDDLLTCQDGLGGTSAAAAHVAGMSALLMSNDGNTSFNGLNESNATSASTFRAIRDYLQSHSVDLPLGAGADGFDTTYGSGLAILGAPSYDLSDTTNPTTPADLLPESCTTTVYVGHGDLDNTVLDGSIGAPFVSIGQALNAGDFDCIVVMPGEYVSPIVVDTAFTDLLVTGYDDVSRQDVGDVIFWLRGMVFEDDYIYGQPTEGGTTRNANYLRRAGLYFTDNAANVEFSGFTYAVADTFSDSEGTLFATSDIQAVVVDGSTDVTVSNSQFGTITLNNVQYDGWNGLNATPVLVLNGAQGVRIDGNTFNDNTITTSGFYPTVAVAGSGGDTDNDPTNDNPIEIINNRMYGNTVDHNNGDEWGAILYSDGSAVDIINNAIYNNTGETIVKISTDKPSSNRVSGNPNAETSYKRRARLVGNVFLNNTTDSNTLQPGPLINARYAPMIYIINNTFVGNLINTAENDFGQFFGRGNPAPDSEDGSVVAGWDFWEIHNNLIYENTFRVLVGDTGGFGTTCSRIPNDADTANLFAFGYDGYGGTTFNPTNDGVGGDSSDDEFFRRGAQNNWIVDNQTISNGSIGYGECQSAINTLKNQDSPITAAYRNQNIVQDDLQPVDEPDDDDKTVLQGALPQDFQGADEDSPYQELVDWQYYALTQTYVDISDNTKSEYSDGIDAAKTRWLEDYGGGDDALPDVDPYMDGADVERDIAGTVRPLDVNDWVINWGEGYDYNPGTGPVQGISGTVTAGYDQIYTLDIGAFEFSPLQFETNDTDGLVDWYNADDGIDANNDFDFDDPNDVEPLTDTLLEDAIALDNAAVEIDGIVTFDFTNVVTGGFGDISFSIAEQPNNYGIQCGPEFENTKGLIPRGAGFDTLFDYCLPENYYSSSESPYVSFKMLVEDEAGASVIGEVRFTIDPLGDSTFADDATVKIGDELEGGQSDENDIFEVVGTLGSDLNVRLRPYVRFDNFFFSENGNSEFLVGANKVVDYPFTYRITDVVDDEGILVGTIQDGHDDGSFGTDPLRNFELSDANKGVAEVYYSVRDANGTTSTDNKLVIRSISVIPTEGLFDDTAFVWNYSDGANSRFYTERADFDTTEAPDSGDWQALREIGAINDTVHTTSTVNDTATFRFVGTGFTLYMRGGSEEDGNTFDVNVYDDDSTMFESTGGANHWQNVLGSEVVSEATDGGDFRCTTRAAIEETNGGTTQSLRHSEENYTITCNGLTVRKHTVQVVNTGGGTLSVDAFAIISDQSGNFDDADPLPPGFYDVDNGILRNAFDGDWIEVNGEEYSNGIALQANTIAIAKSISFTITEASGFAIGSSYRNTATDFEICVDDDKEYDEAPDPVEGVCQTIADDIAGTTVTTTHHPFFGLDPNTNYTITLKLDGSNNGLIFDNLVVFDSSILPGEALPLGFSTPDNTNLVMGEPLSDDWTESDGKQVITEGRSAVGPFVSFEMTDDVDGIAILMTNNVPQPECSARDISRGTCPDPLPTGLSALNICVDRANQATTTGDDDANCIISETITGTYRTPTAITGTVTSLSDGTLVIDETMFDKAWPTGTTTVEIFSLTPDEYLEFTSIQLLSNALGLGAGTYQNFSSGIFYMDYNPADNTYTEVEIGAVAESFVNREITQCFRERRGVCSDLRVVGSVMETTGVGDAVLAKLQGTGFAPIFTESPGSQARVCWVAESNLTETDRELIVGEIQADAYTDGGCQIFDNNGELTNSGQKRGVYGLESDVYWIMIELLPSPTTDPVSMPFDGLQVLDNDWESLTPLDTSQRFEASYDARNNDDLFSYIGSWTTLVDSNDTHSGTTYDVSDGEIGSGIVFQTTGGNHLNIIRDLRSTQVRCNSQRDLDRGNCEIPNGNLDNVFFCSDSNERRGRCPAPIQGYSDILVCVAPVANPDEKLCSTHASTGSTTQDILPISLPDDGNYVVTISAITSDPFVIDAIELIDSTSGKMTVGVYQENSPLIAYGIGYESVLKDTSVENSTLLVDTANPWGWNTSSGVTSSISSAMSYVGNKSILVSNTAIDDGVESEEFQLINGDRYTAVVRVYVAVTGTSVEMDLAGSSPFTAQSTQSNGKWELLRHTFTATSDEWAQLVFDANDANMTFYVDDVNVYRGSGAWAHSAGGLTDGQIATSSGYASTAKFLFNGTGFMVKLASDTNSGETEVCYDVNSDMSTATCFTYDDEQPPADEPVCTGRGRSQVCTVPLPETANNGHSVVGLASGDYYVTVTQMDNGLTNQESPEVCTGSGRRQVCIPGDPANSPNDGATSVKIDYIEIFDNALPPVLDAGGYNEDSLSSGETGLQLFPPSEWTQVIDSESTTYSGNSYYNVNDANAIGSLLALRVENDDPTTIVVDINQVQPEATQLLACLDEIDGQIDFDGETYSYSDDDATVNCVLTTQAASQSQVVFNSNNLPLLDESNTPRLFMLQSLTKDSVIVDGYQIIHGTTLTEGFYQDTLGFAESGAIFTITNVSGTDDWNTYSFPTYNGSSALGTAISGTSVKFTFEGTGFSLLPGTGQPVEVCTRESRGVCISSETQIPAFGDLHIDLDTSMDPVAQDICSGSCSDEISQLGSVAVSEIVEVCTSFSRGTCRRTEFVEAIVGPYTLAGLPYGTYTVIITAELDEGEAVSIDAVEIYGDLQDLGSLYDDAQTTVDGTQLLTFGPANSNWQAVEGASANFLNKTYHQSIQTGATVSFNVGEVYDTQAIVIYDGNATIPDPTCTGSGRSEVCVAPGYDVASSSSVEVCWAEDNGGTSLSRHCETITNLDDDNVSRRVDVPVALGPGEYSVSITNKAHNEPLIIDAIQIIEDGIITEGIYEEDFFSSPADGTFTTPVTNTNATNDYVIELEQDDYLTFTFDGVAFSTLVVENITGTSTNFDICAYANDVAETDCSNSPVMSDNITSLSNNNLSALPYAGFTDVGSPNADGRWTVVIRNNDTDSLYIDRIDVLSNNNDLYIDDTATYEAGDTELRYLPFGSWVENTSFKDGTPFNGNQFETTIPGAITYFEFGSGTFGVEYIRQIQEFIPETEICVRESRGRCLSSETVPPIPPFADANLCYGTIGNPDVSIANMTCVPFDNDTANIFQFGESISPVDCSSGCWAYIEYGLDSTGSSKTTVDFVRLYDPDSTLTAGVYQENHPNISYSTPPTPVTHTNARVGFFNQLDSASFDEYVSFPFSGTGFSVRTLGGENAEDISLCISDYTGDPIPTAASVIGTVDETCLRTYDQEFVDDTNGTFVVRAVHGLDPDAEYLGIVKMVDDGNGVTTQLNIDEITIYNQPWYVNDDLTDETYLNELVGGESYDIDYTTRDTDKYVQFAGDSWATISYQVQTGCADRRCRQPIFETIFEDRGTDSGTTALFRTNLASAVELDLFVNGTGDVQVCAIPLQDSSMPYGIDLTEDINCQTFTVTGRSSVGFVFNETVAEENLLTVELITPSITTEETVCVRERRGECIEEETIVTTTEPWMNIYEVALFDIVAGLAEGQYAASFPGIQYDTDYDLVINETMETVDVDWENIGNPISGQTQPPVVCSRTEIRNGTCPTPDAVFDGESSRKVEAGIGQGIEFVDVDDNGFDLQTDTYYTAVAHVYIDPTTVGTVTMQIFKDGSNIAELDGMNLTTASRGAWQTLRADFMTGSTASDYEDLTLRFVAGGGQTVFFVDNVTLTSGGLWASAPVPLGPDICTGSGRRQTCVPGNPIFDSLGGNIFQSTTPGSSLSFTFVGTGFELGLLGGNRTGQVQVCYEPEGNVDPDAVNCFTYNQDDGIAIVETICTRESRGRCLRSETRYNDTTGLFGRGVVGLADDTWVVTVREMDNGYTNADTTQSRQSTREECISERRGVCRETGEVPYYENALIGIDYVNIFDDTDVVSVPVGVYNEDATDDSDNEYLALYPEANWQQFTGTSVFSNTTYFAPTNGTEEIEHPGPVAMLQVDVDSVDETWAIVFQLGLQSIHVTDSVLVCVDDVNGVMTWIDGQYVLEDSDNCKIAHGVAGDGQVSVSASEIDALAEVGTHTISVMSLSPVGLTELVEVCTRESRGRCLRSEIQPQVSDGNLRIDGYQIFNSDVLTAGLYNEILPEPMLNFTNDLDQSTDCDTSDGWCYTKSKTYDTEVCTRESRGNCIRTEIQTVTTTPYLSGAAVTGQEGATLNFTAQGTGFSIISDVWENGLDFRVCYMLNGNGSSFPLRGSSDETIALQGFTTEDDTNGIRIPVLVAEGGVICEEMTTDTDNWSSVMDRPLSEGERYGFSFYGMPFGTYDVQIMVTEDAVSEFEWFTIDAIQVFSNGRSLDAIEPGIVDNTDDKIIYEPVTFWNNNVTSNTYLKTDSTTTHAGAIVQFKIKGNSVVIYQTIGDMTTDVQVCVIISNDNIHCSVESERQTRIARQVTSYTQYGDLVPTTICTRFRRDDCIRSEVQDILENSPFTPVVFYGLGEDEEHQIIAENRVNGKTFNLDAIQVIE